MKPPQSQVWRIVPDARSGWSFSHRDSDFSTLEPQQIVPIRENSSASLPSMADLLLQDPSSLPRDNGAPRMFQTALGKPVAVKQSSIKRALSVLGEEENMETVEAQKPIFASSSSVLCKSDSSSMFQTGSGKPVAVKASSIRMALSVFGEEKITERDYVHKQVLDANSCFSNSHSLFQTGSGKIVNVSSSELTKARTLLGLEENNSLSTYRGFELMMKNSEHLGKRSAIQSHNKPFSNHQMFEGFSSASEEPAVKFQTAGGRSISVSSDALERAMSLLGESELGVLSNKVNVDDPLLPLVREEGAFHEVSLDKGNLSYSSWQQNSAISNDLAPRIHPSGETFSGNEVRRKVAVDAFVSKNNFRSRNTISYLSEKSSRSAPCTTQVPDEHPSENDFVSRRFPKGRLSSGPLVEISNNIHSECIDQPSRPESAHANQRPIIGDKRRFGGRSSVSPFKRPRRSGFSAPLNSTISCQAADSFALSTLENVSIKTRLSTHYPFQHKRKTLKEFFRVPPHHNLPGNLSENVKCMNAESAKNYKFRAPYGSDIVGPEAFQNMLVQSGASALYASEGWVLNHFKWIVWKQACLERSYPTLASGRYLTVTNVLEELKYRYEREVNHGHKSALKKILEGDVPSTTMMILCITGVHSYPDEKLERIENHMVLCEDPKKPSDLNGYVGKIELSDGWYSLDGVLDLPLAGLLNAGKLFVGQKIRVWGAGLSGWVGPVSPLEASMTVNLVLHMNGTYRAHWADQLGFCKGFGVPLDFRCIKSAGGLVPRTLVGVTRIYPVLYKERLSSGGSVVRSERMETKMLQEYNQRRTIIAEGILSESWENSTAFSKNNNDGEEGAKLYKILERSAEPEVLMATMSSEKLIAFKTYQARQEALRQSDLQKMVEKALTDAGLSSRQVTPFMRVRVVGLTNKTSRKRCRPREGLVTIWQPTEKQVDLVEGCIYSVAGLVPLNSGSDFLHLQARGSLTQWKPLAQSAIENFEPFFTSRRSVLLSNLGEVPLASEFDVAGVIVYVGELYVSGRQKKQWVFVTDASESMLDSAESSKCLLAINFCSSIAGCESFAPVNFTLAGSTVGFFNLVKRPRDQMNCLWVAEATENSTYSFCYNLPGRSHLKEAADTVRKWAKKSCSTIDKLREKVLCILGGRES